jgi:putative holliday junction resolvase
MNVTRRVLGIDVGERRIGLAISDVSGTLARPLRTLEVRDMADGIESVVAAIEALAREDEGLAAIVVGIPRRLDGTANEATVRVTRFVDMLRGRAPVPIELEDERLTSREAEQRLSLRERDWRKRKTKLDAAAAALILQDHLDRPR